MNEKKEHTDNNILSKGEKMLELYYLETCPYCRKVLNYLDENKIKYTAKNIEVKENYDKLIELGKKSQVPFLTDSETSVQMYESDEIINYLSKLINK